MDGQYVCLHINTDRKDCGVRGCSLSSANKHLSLTVTLPSQVMKHLQKARKLREVQEPIHYQFLLTPLSLLKAIKLFIGS